MGKWSPVGGGELRSSEEEKDGKMERHQAPAPGSGGSLGQTQPKKPKKLRSGTPAVDQGINKVEFVTTFLKIRTDRHGRVLCSYLTDT